MTTSGPVLGEERNSEFFDSLDHVIDIHGHIIGMGLSPDHRLENDAYIYQFLIYAFTQLWLSLCSTATIIVMCKCL